MPEFGFYGFSKAVLKGLTDYAQGRTVTSNVSYSNIASVTDGDVTTTASCGSVTTPQYVQVDIGQSRFIRQSSMIFADSSHRSATGGVQASDDGVTFTDAVTWSSDTSTARTVAVGRAGRYWRLNTTATGSPGGTGTDIKDWKLLG